MPKHHESVVEAQFGTRANAYVESAVHAQGADLDALSAMAADRKPQHALDLGTGGGHVTYALAPYATRVTAADLSTDMLTAVAAAAREKGLNNVATVETAAERLPFPDADFDFLACRYSAHHWQDFDRGLRQARRVLRGDAPAIFIDVCSPGPALFDTHLQAVELLRDTSHVRDYNIGEWMTALSCAGFAIASCRTWRLRMDFPVWTARMRTPAENVKAIRALQDAASAETKAHFAIEADGSFLLDMMMIEAVAA
ncbi:MAG: class I SAM-dependent methyltransferase [Bradyrhizobium sp.]|uniref:class I SAM-dependent methyltransferase n=1 Tax=Bradyrhizobium sp. TaxID=376 RepID=UPI001DDF681A|nr:class I SAM-dependent methyltransferase [Bradyrhizobium sp.]MBV9562152.1 class I SAM-dependent methyltransferase [Bradyrhizobium sp.]